MLIYNGKISLYCYLASLMISSLLILPRNCIVSHVWWILPSYYVAVNVFLILYFRGYAFQVLNTFVIQFLNILAAVMLSVESR
jgi:hypothetical protein